MKSLWICLSKMQVVIVVTLHHRLITLRIEKEIQIIFPLKIWKWSQWKLRTDSVVAIAVQSKRWWSRTKSCSIKNRFSPVPAPKHGIGSVYVNSSSLMRSQPAPSATLTTVLDTMIATRYSIWKETMDLSKCFAKRLSCTWVFWWSACSKSWLPTTCTISRCPTCLEGGSWLSFLSVACSLSSLYSCGCAESKLNTATERLRI